MVVGWLVAVGDGGRDASPPPQAARQTARPGLERWQRAPSQRLRPAYPPLPNPPPPPPPAPAPLFVSLPADYGFDPLGLGSNPESLKYFAEARGGWEWRG